MSNWCNDSCKSFMILCVLAVTVVFPGAWSVPPVDRDEARFAQATKQMVNSDSFEEYIVPRVQNKPRLNKPPLIYWLQSLSVKLGGAELVSKYEPDGEKSNNRLLNGGIGWFRLPSMIAAIVSVLATWWIGQSMFASRLQCKGHIYSIFNTGWFAGALLCFCVMVMLDSRQARADQALLAFNTLAMAGLWRIWKNREKAETLYVTAAVMWLFVMFGIMAKGVTLLVFVFTILFLSLVRWEFKWLRKLCPVIGIVVIVAGVVPWVIGVVNKVGFDNYYSIIYDETIGRSLKPRDSHAGPFGYHLLLTSLIFWPGSLLVIPAFMRVAASTRAKRSVVGKRLQRFVLWFSGLRDAELFCIAWIVPTWIFFELVATKLPHYVLPVYPALSLLSARALFAIASGSLELKGRLFKGSVWLWGFVTVVLCIVAPVVVFVAGNWRGDVVESVLLGGLYVLLCICAIVPLFLIRGNRIFPAVCTSLAAAFLLSTLTFQILAPGLERVWLSSRIAAVLREIDPGAQRPLIASKYKEDSLVFMTDGRTRIISESNVKGEFKERPNSLLVIPEYKLPHVGVELTTLREVFGYNYTKGKWLNLLVCELKK